MFLSVLKKIENVFVEWRQHNSNNSQKWMKWTKQPTTTAINQMKCPSGNRIKISLDNNKEIIYYVFLFELWEIWIKKVINLNLSDSKMKRETGRDREIRNREKENEWNEMNETAIYNSNHHLKLY